MSTTPKFDGQLVLNVAMILEQAGCAGTSGEKIMAAQRVIEAVAEQLQADRERILNLPIHAGMDPAFSTSPPSGLPSQQYWMQEKRRAYRDQH